MSAWPLVPLGDVLAHRKEFIQIDDSLKYKRCRVQLHAQGIVLRDEVPGIEIKTKAQQICHSGEFLVAEIDAKVGGFGVVPPDLDGAIVSSHYFLFDVNPALLDIRFLGYFVKTAAFRDQVAAQGSTNYAAIRPSHVLAYTIPLPPIEEQRRIVERIEELAGKADSLEQLGRTVEEEKEELFSRIVSEVSDRLIQSHGAEPLEALTSFIGDMNHEMPSAVADGMPFISPKDFGPDWTIDFGGAKRISPDDFARHAIKCKPQRHDILMARYGTIGAARFVYTDMEFLASYSIAVIRPDSQRVLPRFLFWMVTSRHIQEQAIQGIRGSGMADLGLKTIRLFMIPVVGLSEQTVIVKRLDELRDQTARLCKHSTAALVEIRSFIPSVLNAAFSGQL